MAHQMKNTRAPRLGRWSKRYSATDINEDTALFSATHPGKKSYVDDWKGSWYIQEAISLFEQHYDTEHVIDIMTQVNGRLSSRNSENKDANLYQMSKIEFTLKHKFFLTK